jgi:hypothetical protein
VDRFRQIQIQSQSAIEKFLSQAHYLIKVIFDEASSKEIVNFRISNVQGYMDNLEAATKALNEIS